MREPPSRAGKHRVKPWQNLPRRTWKRPDRPYSWPMNSQSPGGRILVVEDEESISQPFAEALRRAGFEALVTATAAGALELAASEDPDLVMLDLALRRKASAAG